MMEVTYEHHHVIYIIINEACWKFSMLNRSPSWLGNRTGLDTHTHCLNARGFGAATCYQPEITTSVYMPIFENKIKNPAIKVLKSLRPRRWRHQGKGEQRTAIHLVNWLEDLKQHCEQVQPQQNTFSCNSSLEMKTEIKGIKNWQKLIRLKSKVEYIQLWSEW